MLPECHDEDCSLPNCCFADSFSRLQNTGCATTRNAKPISAVDLRIDGSALVPPPATLTAQQVMADSKLLAYTVVTGYGGKGHVPAVPFLSAIDKLDKIRQPMTPDQLRDRVDETLLDIPDNHLKASLDRKTSAKRAAVIKKGEIGKNFISDPEKVWEVRIEKKGQSQILLIAIKRFPSHKDPVWFGFIEAVQSELKGSDIIVLDMRGNGGGDDTKGYDLATLLLGHQTVSPVQTEYYNQAPEAFVLAANGYRLTKLRLAADNEPAPNYLDDLIREQDQKFNLARDGKLPIERIETNIGNHSLAKDPAYKKPIYILMDGACASSCESSIYALETHPAVKKVGQSTGGYLHFGNIGQLVLPNSHVIVQIPTKADEYFDHRFVERVGIQPDIAVPVGVAMSAV